MQVLRQAAPPDLNLPLVQLSRNHFCIVDPEDLPWIVKFDWRAIRSHSRVYAVRRYISDGRYIYIRMHRQIMNCPKGLQVHHVNGNTLDNRKRNLLIIDPQSHARKLFPP